MTIRLLHIPLALTAVLVTVSVLAATAAAHPATTSPAAPAYVKVVITDRNVTVSNGSSAARGVVIIFQIVNRTASTAKLSFLGRVSKPIAPHHRGPLAVFAARRGAFPLVTDLSRHRPLHRTFVVY